MHTFVFLAFVSLVSGFLRWNVRRLLHKNVVKVEEFGTLWLCLYVDVARLYVHLLHIVFVIWLSNAIQWVYAHGSAHGLLY